MKAAAIPANIEIPTNTVLCFAGISIEIIPENNEKISDPAIPDPQLFFGAPNKIIIEYIGIAQIIVIRNRLPTETLHFVLPAAT